MKRTREDQRRAMSSVAVLDDEALDWVLCCVVGEYARRQHLCASCAGRLYIGVVTEIKERLDRHEAECEDEKHPGRAGGGS